MLLDLRFSVAEVRGKLEGWRSCIGGSGAGQQSWPLRDPQSGNDTGPTEAAVTLGGRIYGHNWTRTSDPHDVNVVL